jgi:hypothetical protein
MLAALAGLVHHRERADGNEHNRDKPQSFITRMSRDGSAAKLLTRDEARSAWPLR